MLVAQQASPSLYEHQRFVIIRTPVTHGRERVPQVRLVDARQLFGFGSHRALIAPAGPVPVEKCPSIHSGQAIEFRDVRAAPDAVLNQDSVT